MKDWKLNVWRRDQSICQLCGKPVKGSQRTIDHIVPKKAGGTNHCLNCMTGCLDCNAKRKDMDIREFKEIYTIPKDNWIKIVWWIKQYISIRSDKITDKSYIKGW